jgi:hypothetical protein
MIAPTRGRSGLEASIGPPLTNKRAFLFATCRMPPCTSTRQRHRPTHRSDPTDTCLVHTIDQPDARLVQIGRDQQLPVLFLGSLEEPVATLFYSVLPRLPPRGPCACFRCLEPLCADRTCRHRLSHSMDMGPCFDPNCMFRIGGKVRDMLVLHVARPKPCPRPGKIKLRS